MRRGVTFPAVRAAQPSSNRCIERDVEPPAELAAHLAFDADQLEPARPMQRERRLAGRFDPCHHGMEAMSAGHVEASRSARPCRCPGRDGRAARRPSPRRSCGRRLAPCTERATRTRPPIRRSRRRLRRARLTARRATTADPPTTASRGRTSRSRSRPRGCRSCASPLHRRVSRGAAAQNEKLTAARHGWSGVPSPASRAACDRVSSIGDLQLREDVRDVVPHGLRAQVEHPSDLRVRLAVGDKVEDFALAL